MPATVDPFSVATAELSDDFMKTFPKPDIVPRYLEEVRDKAGVVVFAVDNCINIKGSWISLERARLFLTELLASYLVGSTSDVEKKDFDVFDKETEKPPPREEVESSDEDESDQRLENVSEFQDITDESTAWTKWTNEVLPRIHRIRSKKVSNTECSQWNSAANTIPEPLVLYANYQPTPDPTAKILPTLDAIEKVLKTVYHETNQPKCNQSEFASTSTVCSYPSVNENVDTEKLQSESLAELNHHSTAGGKGQSQEDDSCSDVDGEPTQDEASLSSCAPQEDQQTLPPDVSAAVPSLIGDGVTGTGLSLHQALQEDAAVANGKRGQNQLVLTKEQNNKALRTRTRRQSIRKRKNSMNNDDSGSKKSGGVNCVTESKSKQHLEDTVTSATEDTQHHVLSQVSEVTKSKRKGRPRKNKSYQSKTLACEKPLHPHLETLTLETGRSSKRKNLKAVTAENHGHEPVDKKSGKLQQYSQKVDSGVYVEGKGYVCELCPYSAKKVKHLLEHKRRVHNHGENEFKCEECGKMFGFAKDLKRHYLSHQRAENCCDICGKMYKGVRNLAEHKKTHEINYVKPEFPCEFCQKTFSTKYVLAYHIKSEHLGMKKTYLCPTCGKSFSQKNSYLQHANVHMGIRPYHCDICGRSFSYEKSLKEHSYMHQDGKQFECPVCHKKFRQSSGVAIHMKIHQERKDYVCSACGKGFSQKQALIRHERIHAGDKPFTCSLCKHSFTDSSILRRHMILIHKKDKDKWREDTESHLQRRTDFFINVVVNEEKLSKKDQVSQEGAGFEMMTGDEHNSEQVGVNPTSEPARTAYRNNSCHTKQEGFFIPVDMDSVTSVPQLSSSSESVMTAMPSMSLSHCRQYAGDTSAASNSGVMLSEGAHEPLPAVQSAHHKLEANALFGLPQESTSSSFSQSILVSAPNKDKVSFQEQNSGVLNTYPFSGPNPDSPSAMCSAELQPTDSISSELGTVHYPEMVAQGSADYHSNLLLMSDALASLQYHSGAVHMPASSQEQTADCEDLVTDSSVLQH